MDEETQPPSGYKRPPVATRFAKGRSGNPNGRPRSRRRDIPHDALLSQMVTIRDEGKERRVTAAEAFLLQLTKKGLEGCAASAGASLASIESARASRTGFGFGIMPLQITIRGFGLCCIVEDLGMAVRLNEESEDRVRLKLKPWIVEAGLARMKQRQLTVEEQRTVLASVRTPEKVQWPAWWSVRT